MAEQQEAKRLAALARAKVNIQNLGQQVHHQNPDDEDFGDDRDAATTFSDKMSMEDIMEKWFKGVESSNLGRKCGTLPIDTVQNPWNNGSCMEITTRSGKVIVDEPEESNPVESKKLDSSTDDSEKENEKEEEVVLKTIHRPPPPFPQRLKKKVDNAKFGKFMAMLQKLTINVPLIEELEQMPGYAQFMKDFITKKRNVSSEQVDNLHCSVRESMPLAVYRKLGLEAPTSTNIRLIMKDRSIKWLVGILHDVLVKVADFILPADFVVLDCDLDFEDLVWSRNFPMKPKRKSPTTSKKEGKESVRRKLIDEESNYEEEEPFLRKQKKKPSPKKHSQPPPIEVENSNETKITTTFEQEGSEQHKSEHTKSEEEEQEESEESEFEKIASGSTSTKQQKEKESPSRGTLIKYKKPKVQDNARW
ncbi:uncharacterized protein LOC124888923 [Capsicum annuum]|uniref:uncharacterized protein LOC124888923 n=1 Tax=Capsicum annuum TaxID=4072 RepID=UPI001FB05EC7|nr:uncharacterized protein LOC124888923 [Capsicum annuum]